jgi:hypothetical protein
VSLRSIAFALACLAGIAVAPPVGAVEGRARVRFVGEVRSGRRLVVEDAGGSTTVLALPPWVVPDAFSVSPDRRHALVYAKLGPRQARTGIVLEVGTSRTARETGRFRPGVGGEWYWSPTNGIILESGCGTSCAQVLVHDLTGKKLAHLLCDGFDEASELSSDRRYVACFSSSDDGKRGELQVADTTTGATVLRAHLPCLSNAGVNREGVRFRGDGTGLDFRCYDGRRDVGFAARWSSGSSRLERVAIEQAVSRP